MCDMTSSTKLKVHNVWHCHRKMTKPRSQVTCRKHFVKFWRVVFKICEHRDRQTNRQTDIQTHSSQYFTSTGGDVIMTMMLMMINLFCSLAVLDPRFGHTMDILSPFISVLCHSDWLFHGESCPRIDVVHPGRAWSSLPACTWHCSLRPLFLQTTSLFPHGVTIMLASLLLTLSNSSLFAPALLRTHSFVFLAVHETCEIFLGPFISKPSRNVFRSLWVTSFHSRTLVQDTCYQTNSVAAVKATCQCSERSETKTKQTAFLMNKQGQPRYNWLPLVQTIDLVKPGMVL